MEVGTALNRFGGVAATADLAAVTSKRRVRAALARGEVVQAGRGRVASAAIDLHRRRAVELAATVSHLSAAQQRGWAVKWPPDRPWVTVPRHRKVRARSSAEVSYADLTPEEVADGVTSPLRTVLDCARCLPFDEGLAVADSALRSNALGVAAVRDGAARVRGPGAARVRRVAAYADGAAANPFESVLRAFAIDAGLDVQSQLPVATRTMTFEPDLVDRSRRVVIEADSWEWHSEPPVHERDCVRHTALAVAGWLLLRFTWQQTMRSPAYVRAVLDEVVAARSVGVPTDWQ